MAEKTVSVRLAARVDSYIAAMKAAEASTTNFSRATKRNLTTVGTQMQTVGRSMTMFVSAPLVAAGGFAVKMASDFERSFAQMEGLANVPAEEVDHLKESILDLAGETAQAPQELADALYLAASSGLDSAEAMDVVTLAAHGAAAGMGSTTDIVNLVTGAVGAYGEANLSAAEATDVMAAAIREGRAAPEELAGAMGRVLPIAASMGVSMGEVGGALAFLTNAGVDTDLAVTELRDILVKLAVPGKKASAMLEDMGTSSEELKAAIDQNGLMGALELLREHGFNGNAEALHALMPDIRGLNGLTALLADNSGTLDNIMGRVTNSAGSLGTAFDAVASTGAFKMQKAIAELKVALINIGSILLPMAASMASGLSDVLEMFNSLPKPVQEVLVALGGLAATMGPLVFVAGSFVKNFVLIRATMEKMSGGLSTATVGLVGLAAAVAAGVIIYKMFTDKQHEVDARTREVAVALEDATARAWDYADAGAGAGAEIDGFTVAQRALSQALAQTGEDGEKITKSFGALGMQIDDVSRIILGLQGDTQSRLSIFEDMARGAGVSEDAIAVLAKTIEETDNNGGALRDELYANFVQMGMTRDAASALTDKLMPIASAMEEIDDQSEKINSAGTAQTFLQTAAFAGESADNLIKMAEATSGASRNGDDALQVYYALNDILAAMSPTERAAAEGALGLSDAAETGGAAARTAAPLWGQLWTTIADGADAVAAGMKLFTGTVDDAFAHLEGGIHNAAEAQDALAKIAALGPAGENWVRYAESTIDASRSGSEALLVYQTLMHFLDSANPAFGAFVESQLHLEGAFRKVYGAAAPVADVFSKIGPAASDADDGLYSVSAHLPTLIDRFHFMQDAAGRLRDAFDALNTPYDDLRASTRDLTTGFDDMHDALDTNHHDFNEMGTDWSSATEDGRTMQEQTEATRDAIIGHGIAMLENGHSAAEAAADINDNVKKLNDQWVAAGLTTDQIANLNAQYGLTPAQISTAITLAGAEAAKHTAADYVNYINKTIPGYIETSIKAVPYTANARQAIDALTYSKSVAITPYLTKSELYVSIKATGSAILHSAEGRFVPGGSNMFSSLGEEGGTAGDEVVLPLGNPRRLAQLLGMAQVGPRVAAAMGGGHHEKLVSGYAMSGGGGGDTYINATINMPPGSDGDDVVRVLRKYQRLHGPVPIATR